VEKRFIGPEDLAVYLDIKLNTVYSWVYLKKIPYIKMGRLVKFDLREIESWLIDKKVEKLS